jgi:hypothetical protein
LPANAEKLFAQHFDAMLYVTNWGTRQLMFRLPKSVIDVETLTPYCVYDIILFPPVSPITTSFWTFILKMKKGAVGWRVKVGCLLSLYSVEMCYAAIFEFYTWLG